MTVASAGSAPTALPLRSLRPTGTGQAATAQVLTPQGQGRGAAPPEPGSCSAGPLLPPAPALEPWPQHSSHPGLETPQATAPVHPVPPLGV